jgi:hypothetical protein
MLKNPFKSQSPHFRFRIGKYHVAKKDNLFAVTGFRRIRKTRFFVRSTLTKDFAAGFEQCKQAILAEIKLPQDAGVRVKPKSWDSGFETALEFVARKVEAQQPKP